jgi:hypothetical protein
MPVRHIPGNSAKKANVGKITHLPSQQTINKLGLNPHRNTTQRLETVHEQAKQELAPETEKSIGIIAARETALASGISVERLNDALLAGDIKGAEKNGNFWRISPSKLADWIKEQTV